jgi:hypothetical protein
LDKKKSLEKELNRKIKDNHGIMVIKSGMGVDKVKKLVLDHISWLWLIRKK